MMVLAIGAHPDDLELGADDTIAKHIKVYDEARAVKIPLSKMSISSIKRQKRNKNHFTSII